MPVINPKNLSWTAPTENIDGTPIDYELAYDMGIGPVGGPYEVRSTFPGTLNPDGMYEADLPALNLEDGVEFGLVLRAFNVDLPEAPSAWTDEVEVLFTGKLPNAPAGLVAY